MADKKISALTAATTPLAGTEVLPIVQSGATVKVSVANLTAGRAVAMAGGSFTDNITQSTAAKGVNFTANTPAAGMTSQLLNWYEEGTWTPGFSFGGGTTGITYSTQSGYYTRVGNIVHVTCLCELSNKGSSTGNALLTGLPFTIANNVAAYTAGSQRFQNMTYTGMVETIGLINTTTVAIEQVDEAGNRAGLTNTNFNNTTGFVLQLTYRAA